LLVEVSLAFHNLSVKASSRRLVRRTRGNSNAQDNVHIHIILLEMEADG